MEHLAKQMFHKSYLRLVFALVVITCAFAMVLMTNMFLAPSRQAQRLLTAIHLLRVGGSDFAETERVVQSIGMVPDKDTQCTLRSCTWRLALDNTRIPSIWRGQVTTLSTVVTVESDRLVQISIDFGRGQSARDPKIDFFEQTPELWKMHTPITIGSGFDATSNKNVTASVRVATWAPERDKERYLNFHLNCFAKFHGCEGAHDLLPSQPGPHIQDGDDWLSWSQKRRETFVKDFLTGYLYGTLETCAQAGSLFRREGEPAPSTENVNPTEIGARCQSHINGFSNFRISPNQPTDVSAYIDPITAFYENNPDKHYLTIDAQLLGLRDNTYAAAKHDYETLR